jgi:hypothetical protein
MTRVKDLIPKKVELPKCEAFRWTVYAYDTEEDKGKKRCSRSANVSVDGYNYCRPHAGQIALEILKKGG